MTPSTATHAALLALLLSSIAHAQEKELFYDAPAGAAAAQVQKAAKAMAARCEAYDLKGATGDVPDAKNQPNRIRLVHPKGFTEEQCWAMDFLASFPASKVEFRIERWLGKADEGKYSAEKGAPAGATWVPLETWELADDGFEYLRASGRKDTYLLRDKLSFNATEKVRILRHKGGAFHGIEQKAGVYLEFSKEVARFLYASVSKDPDDPKRTHLLVQILIDGVRLDTGGGMMGWRDITDADKVDLPDIAIWTFKTLTDCKVLPFLIKHPLPFTLTRVE